MRTANENPLYIYIDVQIGVGADLLMPMAFATRSGYLANASHFKLYQRQSRVIRPPLMSVDDEIDNSSRDPLVGSSSSSNSSSRMSLTSDESDDS